MEYSGPGSDKRKGLPSGDRIVSWHPSTVVKEGRSTVDWERSPAIAVVK